MKKSILAITLSVVIVSLSATLINVSTLSKYGSRGDEVREIQSRLQKWGYDIKKVDGIFGSNTQKAVTQFQKNNGLKQDGIAGKNTLEKMGISSNSASGSAETNARLLAKIINAEARGESYTGQVAVGAVVLNRVEHSSFPNTIAGVIYQPGAFTALQDGQWNAEMYDTPYKAAKDALNGWDPTGGAIYYYNPARTTNSWIYSRPVITTIGKHVFAK
ncbi:MAG: spore cortex-lytic enzyme [Clostridia bacterium]|nr:spore cortex-lytic enzyme [Clostridia bacterium]MBQ7075368.1 spore cortex-lytic enzyme [Clostridia bacterium]MBQ9997759.1 spore cortex-lytic enzyme [Clostridia bacterium]